MLSLRSRALVLMVAIAGTTTVAGCGQSDLQKQAIDANNEINTTAEAAKAAADEATARENERLDKRDREDRKGLAKDLVDAVDGAAADAQADAQKKVDTAKGQANDAASNALVEAQKAVERAQAAAKENAENAQDDISKALSDAAAATSP